MNSFNIKNAHMMYSSAHMLTDPVFEKRYSAMCRMENTFISSVVIQCGGSRGLKV